MLEIFCIFILAITVYNIPSMIAIFRYHDLTKQIVLTNIVLGWTVVGWFVALYWALKPTGGQDEQSPL